MTKPGMSPALRESSRLPSYSSQLKGASQFLQEATSLVRAHTRNTGDHVADSIAHLQKVERLVLEHAGLRIEGLDVLDVGAGQRLLQASFFAYRGNRVVGIDRDVIVRGLDPSGYFRMARSNGTRRLTKTLGRKLLGIDARYAAELRRQIGVGRERPRIEVLQMDATALDFADASFDFAYSLTVMQYVADPARALAELARVVRPGGGVYVDFLPFTGMIGSFDIRTIGGGTTDLPEWAHLRPQFAPRVREAAYLNGLRLSEWSRIVETAMPGNAFVIEQPQRNDLEPLARRLHADGELLEYGLDELLTSMVSVVWRKPLP